MSSPERSTPLTACLLRPCILVHLIGTSAHGYDLRHTLLGIGLDCDLGNVYRALNTMEAEGLLRSTWERTESGRSRRRYELTEAGTRAIDGYVQSVETLVGVAEAFALQRSRRTDVPAGTLGVPGPGVPATGANNRDAKVLSVCTD